MDSMPKMPMRASIEKVENGYIVSGSDKNGNMKQMVCKDMNEATMAMKKMMGENMGKETGKKHKEKVMRY